MRAALAEHDLGALQDEDAHCLATALIAWKCSATEAMLASVAKEIQDALGPGDAAWRDLAADRRGLACARNATDEAALVRCCAPARGT